MISNKEKMDPDLERIKFLTEQYKLLEERRKTFGNQFMQMIGFTVSVFALLLTFFVKKNNVLLSVIFPVFGVIFIIIAFLGYRLGRRQDDCEKKIDEIEGYIRGILGKPISFLPPGAKRFGARKVIITVLVVGGLLLIFFSLGLLII